METRNPKNFISVVVCTYNRCESLKETLESVIKQKRRDDFDYEVLLIDNNSTDQTKEFVQGLMRGPDNRVKYVFEKMQGLSFARNRGIGEALGDIIVFTDDDVVLSEDWLLQLWTCFKENDCDAVGGRILPVYPEKTPQWIKDHADLLSGPIVKHDYGEETKVYQTPQMKPFVGANMAFRKELYNERGFFRIDIGAGKGTVGDDTEFYFRLARSHKKIFYCGRALVWHPVDEKRMNLRYIAKYKMSFGRYLVLIDDQVLAADKLVYYFGIPRYAIREVTQSAFKLLFNIFNKRKFIELWNSLFLHAGIISQFRRNYKQARQPSTDVNILQKVRRLTKLLFCRSLYYTGGLYLFIKYVFLKKKSFPAVIMNYHSFSSEDSGIIDPGAAVNLSLDKFRKTLDFILKYFDVISLDALVDHLKTGKDFDRPVIAVTIDDGYRDNYTTMFPVLKEKQIPATIFLAAGFISTEEKIWVDRLLEAISKTKERDLKLQGNHDGAGIYDLSSKAQKYASYNTLAGWLKGLPVGERKDALSKIEEKLNYQPSKDRIMLDWEEVREMENAGITFGAHSVSHPILSRMPVEEAKQEILESKRQIEKHLGHAIKHFAFPNGRAEDFIAELGQFCRDTGFASISSTEYGANREAEDRWFLKRVCPCWPMSLFRVYLLRAFYRK